MIKSKFSTFFLFIAIISLLLNTPASGQSELKKPNVLLIHIDDLNDWVGCLNGHPNALTPNIDKLAEKGVLFTNAHCSAPVCNPSRVSMLFGLAPYKTGVYQNGDDWKNSSSLTDAVNIPEFFKKNGYYTMNVGKTFHERRDDLDTTFFHEIGGVFGRHNINLISKEYSYPFTDVTGIHNVAFHWGPLEGNKAQDLSDIKVADWAAERFSQEYERPFFLSVGIHRPHTPLTAPKEFFSRFEKERACIPFINEQDLDDIPSAGRQMALTGYQEMQNGSYEQIKKRKLHLEIVESYLAATTFLDFQIGKVISALENSPYRNNTIVVLASDHGWNIGEKTHFKKWSLWENTTHVPLVVYAPGKLSNGKQTDAGATLLDIFPTLIDLCNLPLPTHQLDGKSLLPLLENTETRWERPAITTYGRNNHAIRTKNWRYIQYFDGSEELYNHKNDPQEWNNLANKIQYQDIKSKLVHWVPKINIPAVNTDHDSIPLKLTPKNGQKNFLMISDKFINKPLNIKAKIGPGITDGVIVTLGSQFSGFSLYIKNNQLCFSMMEVPTPITWNNLYPNRVIIKSDSIINSELQEIVVQLDNSGNLNMWSNGQKIGSGKAKKLSVHPAGTIILGKAPENRYGPDFPYVSVGDYFPPFNFLGDIKEVIIDNK